MSATTLSLGFSPCPNDCFIFDAMIHGRVDTEDLRFEVRMEDVEALNRRAFAGETDISKLSYHAFAYCTKEYVLLDAGSALGRNCGPLVVSKRKILFDEVMEGDLTVAIPGKYTTANFLFGLAFPKAQKKKEMIFSSIEEAVLSGAADVGLIIHENRFTYEKRGLQKIIDLGEFWEEQTELPIPLGGVVVRRSLPDEVKAKVNRVLRRSVIYAMSDPHASKAFVKANAQELEDDVIRKHINLFVNDFSIDLGREGRKAVKVMFAKANELGIIPELHEKIFLTELPAKA